MSLSFFGDEPCDKCLFARTSAPSREFTFDGHAFCVYNKEQLAEFIKNLAADLERGRFSVHACELTDDSTTQKIVLKAMHNATTRVQLLTQDNAPLTRAYTLHSNESLLATLQACL
jgi:hypothetical protein